MNNSAIELDCMTIYRKEKQKVFEVIHHLDGRINLAVGIWGSPENSEHMCLTANYIDFDWRLQKKMLNFIKLDIYGNDAPHHVKEVSDGIRELFIEYSIGSTTLDKESARPGGSLDSTSNSSRDKLKGFDKFLYETSQNQNTTSDLDKFERSSDMWPRLVTYGARSNRLILEPFCSATLSGNKLTYPWYGLANLFSLSLQHVVVAEFLNVLLKFKSITFGCLRRASYGKWKWKQISFGLICLFGNFLKSNVNVD
ncbi:unnamed protein product [Fraxinus pennsylvanica]|uniref:Uncharacterized protein n=1 Tax=Fraxinus pennsylvanica TaxID=56036 RepID=A0AAD2DQ81_9LAMI|nr:unnamed protein product [Fraxinus pennsylvanica]